MDRAELASKHPELLAQIETAAKQLGAEEARAAAASAVEAAAAERQQDLQTALADRMSLVIAVAGAEAAQKVEALAAAGVTPAQLEALSALSKPKAPAGTQAQQAFLAHLVSATPAALNTGTDLKGNDMAAAIDRIASL